MFKQGDKVLCINGQGDKLLTGATYTVLLQDSSGFLCLEEYKQKNPEMCSEGEGQWCVSRFILASSQEDSTHTTIRVNTGLYEYQGLYCGTVIENAEIEPDGEVFFKHNGKRWRLKGEDFQVVEEDSTPIKSDVVNSPSHYAVFDGVEAIEIIARALTQEEFRGYCFGNLLKYRLRCGKKDGVEQELKKADKYKELYEDYKHLCWGE